MKRNNLQRYGTLAVAATGVFLGRGAYATTQITFEGLTNKNVDISTIAGYGDNVAASSADYSVSAGASGIVGTPNIDLTWGAGYQTYTNWDGRGSVGQTDYNASGGGPIDLLFTPGAGFGVLVNAFDLDNYADFGYGGKASVAWSLFDTVGPLASGTFTKAASGGRTTISTGLTSANVNIGSPVTLRFTLNAGSPSYLAMDNLVFDQIQVPEPSIVGLGLLGAGLGALALRRRKQV